LLEQERVRLNKALSTLFFAIISPNFCFKNPPEKELHFATKVMCEDMKIVEERRSN